MTTREQRRIYMRAYRKRRPDTVTKQNSKYRAEHVEYLKAYAKEYRRKNKTKLARYHKARKLRIRYGLSLDAYKSLIEAQNNLCAICGKPPNGGPAPVLAVDHNHFTGRVRGLLCDKCNKGLGQFLDSEELLRRAVEYLEKHRS